MARVSPDEFLDWVISASLAALVIAAAAYAIAGGAR